MTMERASVIVGVVAMALSASLIAAGQSALEKRTVPGENRNSTTNKELATPYAGPVIGEIDDPSTGCRWFVLGNKIHQEGPGRLVLASDTESAKDGALGGGSQSQNPSAPGASSRPVIHAGDTVVVEEHTTVVDARLAAVALGSAAAGEEFRARLKIGGKVIRARATDSVTGMLVTGGEAQP
jgi:hypothetical protein